MAIFSRHTTLLTSLSLASIFIPLYSTHADIFRTSTGQCIVTSNEYMEGSYQDPNNGKFWKYVPCDSAGARAQSRKTDDSSSKKPASSGPAGRLKGSFKTLVSSLRNGLNGCLPFSTGSCSRAPDTIPVTWLALNNPAGGLAYRITRDHDRGSLELHPTTRTRFPRLVKTDKNGKPFIDFDKTARMCQALQNDPRYVSATGELSSRPRGNSILSDYNNYTRLSDICHELIHMGECASCKSPISSEKEAYEFQLKAAQAAARFAPRSTKSLFIAYTADRAAFVTYMTCRETADSATCVAVCQRAGHSAERCQTAGDFYGTMHTQTIGDAHQDEKPLILGTLISGDPMVSDELSNANSEGSDSPNAPPSGDAPEPVAAVSKFSLSDGTVFACPAGSVGFRVHGSDNIERGYCCLAGSTSIVVGANLDGQCV